MNTRAEILQMVKDGVITQEEAQRLIEALSTSETQESGKAEETVRPPEGRFEGVSPETEKPRRNPDRGRRRRPAASALMG